MTKNGLGQLEIANQNTFTGAVVVNAGTLYANPAAAPITRPSAIPVRSRSTAAPLSEPGPTVCLAGMDHKRRRSRSTAVTAIAENGDQNIGLVTLNGGTLSSVNEDGYWGSFGTLAGLPTRSCLSPTTGQSPRSMLVLPLVPLLRSLRLRISISPAPSATAAATVLPR